MSARTVSKELRSRCGWTETGESIQKGYGLRKGQVEQEGRMRSSRRVFRSKRWVAISTRIVVRSSKSVQVQKTCSEVQKKCFPWKSGKVEKWKGFVGFRSLSTAFGQGITDRSPGPQTYRHITWGWVASQEVVLFNDQQNG